jgi:hypothetical protein
MSAAEVLVDVAKHGTGALVVGLRRQGFTPEKIDQLTGELGLEVRER